MSYATTLWRGHQKGRQSLEEVCECLIRGVDGKDFEREIDSMSPEMLSAFAAFVAPTSVDESGPQWEEVSVSSLEMHAFEFDFEKACEWKVGRLTKLNLLCQRKLSAGEEGRNPAPEP